MNERMNECKEKFKILCMLLIMYGIKQVYRMNVRLATGPGGLIPTWILAPVAVRIFGSLHCRFGIDQEVSKSKGIVYVIVSCGHER